MKTVARHRSLQMCAVLVLAGVMILTGPATAAYNQGNNQQGPYQGQAQRQGYQAPQRGPARNMQIEQQLASQLRNEGYGEQGQIMILALGNRVVLLGTVPNNAKKTGAGDLARSVPGVENVDNRLHVMKEGRQVSDVQLRKNIDDNLPDNLRKTVQVQAQSGVVTLTGRAQNWNEVADAIDAAFAAGAQEVNSHFSVAGAQGYFPSYGYMPGQEGTAGVPAWASTADLRLSQRVAQQLRQQLPPEQNVQLIQPQSIYVTASNGTVTLHGYVQDSRQKLQAAQAAQDVPGVRSVHNDLTILSTQGGPAQPGAPGAGRQGGYSQPQGYTPGRQYQSQQGMGGQGGMPGQAGMGNQQGSGGPAGQQATMTQSDMALAQQVAQKLQEVAGIRNVEVMKPGTIYVSARQGTIVLDGFVQNPNVTQQATRIARAIPGVRNVQSMLKVIAGPGESYPSYGYVPGQGQQGQMGQETQGFEGQPGAGTGGQGTTSGQNTGGAQFSQTAYRGQSNTAENTGTEHMGGQYGAGRMAAPSLPPIGMSPSDMALAWQVAQKLQQQMPKQWVQVIQPDTIYVAANQGTVMLYGFVTDPSAKQHASQVAQSVSGVQNVSNSLGIVGAGAPPAPGYIPGQESQPGNQQFGNNESDTEGGSDEEFVIIEPGDDDESDTGTY
jgi:hyperosmotically inducible protein